MSGQTAPVDAAPDRWDAAALRHALGRTEREMPVPDGAVPAAVLVPLVNCPDGVLLTRRAAGLRRHAGQVAFPGGRMDPSDGSPEAAALREAEEEIGLAAADVLVIGRLPGQLTGTGYHVTPVVGVIDTLPRLRLCPDEVAATFVLPLCVLRDPAAPERRQAVFDGVTRSFWVWPHEDEYIWGATAAILKALARAIARTDAPSC